MTDSMANTPHSSSFLSRPATRAGVWAGWAALTTIAVVIVTIILSETFERDGGTLFHVTRLILVAVSSLSGIGALVLALRALLARRERSIIVWAAFGIGMLMATGVVAELTGLME